MNTQFEKTADPEHLSRTSLYVAGLAAAVISLMSMGDATGDNILTYISSALVATGFFMGWNSRIGTGKERKANTIISFIIAGLFGLLFILHAASYGSLMETGLFLTIFLPAILAVFSFRLKTDWSVLYVCMLAFCNLMFSLTFGLKANSIFYFTGILVLISFALLQQNILSDRKKAVGSISPIKAHIVIIVFISATVILAGIGLRYTIYPKIKEILWPQMRIPAVITNSVLIQTRGPVPVASNSAPPSNVEMFRVKCSEPLFWRNRVFTEYNFGAWSNSDQDNREIRISDRPSAEFTIPEGILREGIEDYREVPQQYQYTNMRPGTLLAANEPEKIIFNAPNILSISNGGLRREADRNSRDNYLAISRVSNATPEQLRTASDQYPERIKNQYLSNVQGVDKEVYDLARRLTANYDNAYDKAFAIQMYLVENFTYNITAPATPENRDAVSYFLYESREGYCDVFSSSMAVMCRSLGIPCRWVTGFSSGDYNSLEQEYVVRSRNAHAWVEVYFPGYGWIEFDPTPAGDVGRAESLFNRVKASLTRLRMRLVTGTPVLLIAGAILLLILYLLRVDLLSKLDLSRLFKRRSVAPRPLAIRNYHRMCNIFAKFGYARDPSTTPSEYEAKIEAEFDGRVRKIVELVTEDFINVKYAHQKVSDERIKAATEALSDLKTTLSNAKKRRLLPQTAGSGS